MLGVMSQFFLGQSFQLLLPITAGKLNSASLFPSLGNSFTEYCLQHSLAAAARKQERYHGDDVE